MEAVFTYAISRSTRRPNSPPAASITQVMLFYLLFYYEYNLMSPTIGSIPRTFLCAREETAEDGIYKTVFSVPPPRADLSTTIKQRAVVQHRGDASGKGTWQCSKDLTATSCPHIVHARHPLQQHIKHDMDAYDEEAGLGKILYQGTRHLCESG